MNEPIIITTPAELRSIVADEVAAILPKLADFRRKNEPVEIDNLSVEEAVRFIAEQGIPTTRSTIYNWVFLKKIPFKKLDAARCFPKRSFLLGSNPVRLCRRTDGPLQLRVSPKVLTANKMTDRLLPNQ